MCLICAEEKATKGIATLYAPQDHLDPTCDQEDRELHYKIICQQAALTSALTDLAPSAVQIEASFGTVPLNAVLGAVAVPAQGGVASGGHSDGLFESIAFTPDHPHDVPALAEQLATGPLGVVRAKGYIAGKDGDIWLLQTVGKRWQAERLDHHPTTQLVCIGPKGQLATDEIRSLVQPTL